MSTFIKVQGTDRTAVEGVFAQLRELVSRFVRDAEAAEREAANQEAAERAVAAPIAEPRPTDLVTSTDLRAHATQATLPWWQNPWLVGTGSAVIAGVILLYVFGMG